VKRLLVAFVALYGFVYSPHSGAGAIQASNVCALLKKEKAPVAYLLDKNGRVNRGPIDFGRYAYRYEEHDLLYIPTSYRVVIAPRRMRVVGVLGSGSLELKETVSVCSNSRTYEASYTVRGTPLIRPDRLPWSENNDSAEFPLIEDPSDPQFDQHYLEYRFDRRVIGEIYDAKEEKTK
jgi:hypothetical protein